MGKKILPTTQTYQHQPSLCNVLYIYRFQLHRPPHEWAIRECLFPNKGPDHVQGDCSHAVGIVGNFFCWMRKFKNHKSKMWWKTIWNVFFYFSRSINPIIYNPSINLPLLKPNFLEFILHHMHSFNSDRPMVYEIFSNFIVWQKF